MKMLFAFAGLFIGAAVAQDTGTQTRADELRLQREYQLKRLSTVDEQLRQTFLKLMGATKGTIEGMQDMLFGLGGNVESWKLVSKNVDETILRLQSGHGAMALSTATESAKLITENLKPVLQVIQEKPEALKTVRDRLLNEFPAASRRAASNAAQVSDLKQQHREQIKERRAATDRLMEIDQELAKLPAKSAAAKNPKAANTPPPMLPPPAVEKTKPAPNKADDTTLDDAVTILDFLERGDRSFQNANEMKDFFARHPSLKSFHDAVNSSPERRDTLQDSAGHRLPERLNSTRSTIGFRQEWRPSRCTETKRGKRCVQSVLIAQVQTIP